jgi:tetratricopeptide (TPR) repeat protein
MENHIALQIGGVIIPQAFSQALQDGMSVPLYIHLAGSQGRQDDQRIGSAFIWLDDGQLRIRKIQLEESEDNASVSEQTRQQLMALANAPFNEALTIPLTDNAQLDLSLRQLLLQLVVKREALGTVLRSRSEDIGQSSVNTLSSNLSYNLGVYNNQLRNGGSNTSSYLSLNNVTALREHHVVLDGSLYGIGSGQQDSELYKAMYERDFAGHRFAGGMLDTWNLQSLGPMTAISAGKIYGLSWGNQASSTIFDSSQSARSREKTRQEQIERIESAILDLDTLCRRAPTTERLNLLGSAYKRLALIEDEGPRRTEALVNMAEHYRLAYERKRDAYAFTNWLAGSLLTRQRGETLATVDPASQQRELEGLLRELAQRNEADPNFWDSASLADLQLIRLLSQPAAPPKKRGDSSLPPAMAVLATYRNAIARGASPREVSSVAEHIAFLIALWSPDDKPKQRILQQIQENLS